MENRRHLILALLIVGPLFGGARGCFGWDDPPPPPDECICTAEYAPVCGSDGNTYGNACEAGCAGVMIDHEGTCRGESCTSDYECGVGSICQSDPMCVPPPCGFEGADCDWRGCGGTCEACACPEIWSPVCGTDGNTYGNDCEARCAHVGIAAIGECGGPVECTDDSMCAPDEMCRYECVYPEPPPGGHDGDGSDGGAPRDWADCVEPPECRGACVPRVECPPLACDVWCEYGHVTDEHGCITCECLPPPPPPPPPEERLCYSDDECYDFETCDHTECRSACDCAPGEDCACPAVCLGVCRGAVRGEPEPVPAEG